MSTPFDKEQISIPCENCARETKKSIGWIKLNKHFTCACGTNIRLDTDQFKREIAKVDAAFASLQKTLKQFGK